MVHAGVARATETLLRTAASTVRGRAKLQVSIDNLDGNGARNYSDAVVPDAAVRIERTLNAPSRCTFDLLVTNSGLPIPVRRGRITVSSNGGGVLFTGFLPTEPIREYAGGCRGGEISRVKVNAISDEWLLDELGPGLAKGNGLSLGVNARMVLERLLQRVEGSQTSLTVTDGGTSGLPLGALQLADTAAWSAAAGAAATAAYAAFRTLDKQVLVQPAGSTVHPLSEAVGTLSIAELQTSQVRELANDITVSGDEEPTVLVTDVFAGDGVTTEFTLSAVAFRGKDNVLLDDGFTTTSVDTRQWSLNDAGAHLSVTSAGLTMNGGNGVDGDTTLTALDAIEMGGSVVAELRGVKLAANSDGMLAGFYAGPSLLAACFAGFRVRQSAGTTLIVPVVLGAEVGTAFPAVAGHSYRLRVRLYCPEMQRVMQRYSCMLDGVVQTFGSGSAVDAPMRAVFDLLDEGDASNAPATVLYDNLTAGAALALTPATCAFVAVNSTRLFGSIASIAVMRTGSLWVESTLADGTKQTRLVGARNEGNDCSASFGNATSGPGKLNFFAGRVPATGERVTAFYRLAGRSVARIADAASIAAEVAAGGVGASRWIGKVLQPPARSSADCETAAQSILAFATSRAAAVAGTYTCINPAQDVWPGDSLEVTSEGVTTALLVRRVAVTDLQALPAKQSYKIDFANDWATELADGLGVRLSEHIAADAWLPETAMGAPASLANLDGLQVVSVSGSALTIDAGVDPPAGGGFEVRRRDGAFGTASAVDLVQRSPVRTFSIPRAAQVERYYVRMYDAGAPAKYSRFSSAVFTDVPVDA